MIELLVQISYDDSSDVNFLLTIDPDHIRELSFIIKDLPLVSLSFSRINYIEFPVNSGKLEPESGYCAMLDENIYPKVSLKLTYDKF